MFCCVCSVQNPYSKIVAMKKFMREYTGQLHNVAHIELTYNFVVNRKHDLGYVNLRFNDIKCIAVHEPDTTADFLLSIQYFCTLR